MFNVQFNAGASREKLAEARQLLGDMTPVYQDIGEYMVQATRDRFVKGQAPDGTAWAPKKQSTLERYKRMGYGNLAKPLIGPGRRLSREIQTFVTGRSVEIGSSLIYSGVMQNGASKGAFGKNARGRPIPWGNIPARVWLGIAKADELAIVEIAEEHLEGSLGG